MKAITRSLLTFSFILATLSTSLVGLSHNKVSAFTGADFQAGHIIDDGVFFNPYGLSAAQVQTFLNSKVPACDFYGQKTIYDSAYQDTVTRAVYSQRRGISPPFTCLRDYGQSIPGASADAYCTQPVAAGSFTAAEIISNVSKACGVNPEVLIVLLQKEQTLVTDDWPWPNQYRSATGYGCPDTAACDSAYYGFYNQVYNAAHQFRRYAVQSSSFNYVASRNNYIQYNPDTSCGGSTIYIQNQATAGLYNYTPYQPNQAALNNLYGTGDSCSAYGNRNFWRMFTEWFGSTFGDLVKTQDGGIYKIENGQKRAFPSELVFFSYNYRWSDVVLASSTQLSQTPDGAAMTYNVHFRDGVLVASSSGGVYVVDNGTKRPFPNEGTFFSFGYKYSDALVISTSELGLIPEGTPMQYNVHKRDGFLVTSSRGGVYVVSNGTKRPFPNEFTFFSNGYKYTDALSISNEEMSLIPDGVAMPYVTSFRNGKIVTSSSSGVYRVENGTKRPFPNEFTFFSNGYKWTDLLTISNTEIGSIPDGAAMSYNVHFRDGHLVTSSTGGVYVVDNGTKRPFPNESTFFSYGYKYSDALVISTSELGLIPEGTPMPPKT